MSAQVRRLSLVASLIACALLLTACGSAKVASTAVTPSIEKPIVVAIGDSIMNGFGLSTAEAWPALLAASNNWALTNLACDGAGFLAPGDPDECDSDFSGLVEETAALHPALILISGSSNDLGDDDGALFVQTDTVVKALRSALPDATIVGISTVWNDTDTPSQITNINEQVRQAMKQVGGLYLDIGQPFVGHRDWLQSDDVHPTAKGQQELAKVIGEAIRSSNLILHR